MDNKVKVTERGRQKGEADKRGRKVWRKEVGLKKRGKEKKQAEEEACERSSV